LGKEYLAQFDKAEETRVKEVVKGVSPEDLDIGQLFRSEVVHKTVNKGGGALLSGYNATVLPTVTMFHERTLLEICVLCGCVREPKVLEPYLERDLVIPILRSPYSSYSTAFVETLMRYPHISMAEERAFRFARIQLLEKIVVCPDCAKKRENLCLSSLEKLPVESAKRKELLKMLIGSAFLSLRPYPHPDYLVLNELMTSLKEKDLAVLDQLISFAETVGVFRTAQVYSAIPQVSMESLKEVEEVIGRSPDLKMRYDFTEIYDSVMRGLKLSYNPSIPLETYLDIVMPRRSKIQGIVSDAIQRSQPKSKVFLSNLQKEIEKVNREVESLKSSTRAKLLNFATNFVADNKSIIAGCIIGAGLGFAQFGLIGCGGGFLGGVGAKLLGTKAQITLPKEAKDIVQALHRAIEPGYEKLLSHYLSKRVNLVQVWKLQEKVQPK